MRAALPSVLQQVGDGRLIASVAARRLLAAMGLGATASEAGRMTPADLQRIRSSTGWRRGRVELFHDTSVGSVIVKGQRAQRPAWRYRLLNGLARLSRLPLLKAAPAHGGARAQQVEVDRLRRLAAAGVPVPQVLHVEDEFFVQSWLGDARLDQLLRRSDALLWWQRGMRALVEPACARPVPEPGLRAQLHRPRRHAGDDRFRGRPARSDDAGAGAGARLAGLSACQRAGLQQAHAGAHAECVALLRAELAHERAPVRQLVADTARRLRWVQRLPAGDGRGWRRHLAILHLAVGLMLAADLSDDNLATDPKVTHARHH